MSNFTTNKITGDQVSANEWNQLADINNAITSSGQTSSTLDLNQLGKTMAGYAAISTNYTDSGAANAYVLSAKDDFNSPFEYADGMEVGFIVNNPNTGPSTVNVEGLGVRNIKMIDGSSDPDEGYLDKYIRLQYDGSVFRVIGRSKNDSAPLKTVYDSAQAESALADNEPIYYNGSSDLSVTIDFSGAASDAERNTILQNYIAWARSSVVKYGFLKGTIADGLHKVGSDPIILDGTSSPIYLEAEGGSPEEILISGLSSTLDTGNIYDVTVTVADPLPARVVADYPIGLQNVRGDNNADFFSGAVKVITIAGDRLSFTCKMFFAIAPTDPTTITTSGTDNSMSRSRCLVPYAAIGFNGGTAATEGLFNLYNKTLLIDRYVGWSYYGSSSDGTVFYISGSSRMHSKDKSIFAGGPERIVRLFDDGVYFANRCCYGGAGVSNCDDIFTTQSGGAINLIRCSINAADRRVAVIGFGTSCGFSQCFLTSGDTASIEGAGTGSDINVTATSIKGATRGVYATGGAIISVDDLCDIDYCTTALGWLSSGIVEGNPFSGSFTGSNNTSLSQSNPNIFTGGGIWKRDSTTSGMQGGKRVSIANNDTQEIKLQGTGGIIFLTCESVPQCTFIAAVDVISPGTVYEMVFTGSEVNPVDSTGATDLGAVSLPYSAGKVSFTVYDDSSTFYIQILNEDAGTRSFRLVTMGDLYFDEWQSA